jgi:hypothetical protein
MSHELIAYLKRRLTRTPPLTARSPVNLELLWLLALVRFSKSRAPRQELKNHKRHVPATDFCTGICNHHVYTIVRSITRGKPCEPTA